MLAGLIEEHLVQIGNIRRQRHHPIRTVVQRLIEDDHVEELIASRRQQAPAHRTESGFKAIGLRISPCRADRARINVRTEYLPSSTCRAEPDRASPAPHVAQRLSGPWLIQACRREVVDEEPGRTTRARLVHPLRRVQVQVVELDVPFGVYRTHMRLVLHIEQPFVERNR